MPATRRIARGRGRVELIRGHAPQLVDEERTDAGQPIEVRCQRLPTNPGEATLVIAVGVRQQVGNPGRGLVAALDVVEKPVGLDERDVIEQGADAVQRRIGPPVDHLRGDRLELPQRVAPRVLHRGEPASDLRLGADGIEDEPLAVGHATSAARRSARSARARRAELDAAQEDVPRHAVGRRAPRTG